MYYVLYMYLYQACAAGCWASIGLPHGGGVGGGGSGVHDSLKNTKKKLYGHVSTWYFCTRILYFCICVSVYRCISVSLYLFISLSCTPVQVPVINWCVSAKVPPWRGQGGGGWSSPFSERLASTDRVFGGQPCTGSPTGFFARRPCIRGAESGCVSGLFLPVRSKLS